MFDSGQKAQYMDGQKEKFVRLEESSPTLSFASDTDRRNNTFNVEGFGRGSRTSFKFLKGGVRKGSEGLKFLGRSLRFGASREVFPEDLKSSMKTVFDPQDKFLILMNRLFVISCILAVAVDPLFYYLPINDENEISTCLGIDQKLAVASTTVRTIIDCFYLIRMVLQFRTGYIAPSTRVFGRGELVIDQAQIAKHYLRSNFIIDFLSVLPLPQIVVWRFLHRNKGSDVLATKNALFVIILLQYIPRLCRIIPLTSELKRTAGVFAETAWAGAAYYLLWFMLACHVVGSFWYLLSVEREDDCWQSACKQHSDVCVTNYLYCGNEHLDGYEKWKNASAQVLGLCTPDDNNNFFQFGIYGQSLTSGIVASKNFISKIAYCFWWGLQNVSTLGQGLQTSTYVGEVIFSIVVAVLGLVLFALIISNMQTYLQSMTIRLEEMRVKRRDSEQWMHHRMLPPELRECVRRYDQYKWLETRGVDEEGLVQSLPKDLRRDIKRHLCMTLVRRVPLFENLDERLLDAVCERLKPSLYTENTYILREGDPVDEMFFIIRGRLESITTDGGRSGFFNRTLLQERDFCGEELLTWALDPKAGCNLPTSTRTVKALSEVEAFALNDDELKFVASQFRRLHSRQVQHTFRFYSQQWRTWAACFIQAAWRRYVKRKMAELLQKEEEERRRNNLAKGTTSLGAAIYASRFVANAMRGVHRLRNRRAIGLVRLQKPPEPDFTAEDAD
ncbi:probable cyclic nucleotide-gated ion channel 5 [Zingiber officinale]|uniref:probable cyclic nucleotide-gated ion channel 5 n=1 Tax=Zingiber officinale TaxID=94328 RepID=UPI001C4D7783|nr:probable cyclic nucleotide-gated ion channel 5 [Zingiber officinale]